MNRWVVWLASVVVAAGAFGCSDPQKPGPPDIFLVTVDTLRADRLGAYGSGRSLTPGLDRLAAESVVFENAYAPVPYTVPSVSGLLTGRHPLVTGVTGNFGAVPDSVPTLAEFDRYDDRFDRVEVNRMHPERIALKTREAALTLFDELKQLQAGPIFLWVHFQDPDGPYTPPEEYREGLLDEARAAGDGKRILPISEGISGVGGIPDYQQLGDEREAGFYRASYDAEVVFVDTEISALLEGLRARGALDDAIVVFASDHGEALGEGDYWFAHGETLGESVMRIPLMIRAPGRASERRTDLASLQDVQPTLLSLLDIEGASGEGRDLFAAPDSEPTLLLSTLLGSSPSRYALVTGDEKYLVAPSSKTTVERLHPLRDDSTDLSAAEPERIAELRAQFERLLASHRRAFQPQRQTVSEVEREKLRALGYIERD